MSSAFIFVTMKSTAIGGLIYEYDDKLAIARTRSGCHRLLYSAQKVHKTGDSVLLHYDNLYVFVRESKQNAFWFAGKVVERSVHSQRTKYCPLKMNFKVDPLNSDLGTSAGQLFERESADKGMGCFKRAVYRTLGATPLKGDGVAIGIVPVSV